MSNDDVLHNSHIVKITSTRDTVVLKGFRSCLILWRLDFFFFFFQCLYTPPQYFFVIVSVASTECQT